MSLPQNIQVNPHFFASPNATLFYNAQKFSIRKFEPFMSLIVKMHTFT